MVVSLSGGTPTWTPNPYYGDPEKGAPNFGKPPNIIKCSVPTLSKMACGGVMDANEPLNPNVDPDPPWVHYSIVDYGILWYSMANYKVM